MGLKEKFTSQDIAVLDINSSYLGISTLMLMENAGCQAVNSLLKYLERKKPGYSLKEKIVTVFCGTGNNGGDGFVFARHAACHGALVNVILVGSEKDIRTEIARVNWEILKKMFLSVKTYVVRDSSQFEGVKEVASKSDVVVDALLGTGARGTLREPLLSAVKLINKCKGIKVSIDVPTGLNSDTGEVLGEIVKPELTVTFHGIKRGFKDNRVTGEILVSKIGIPPEAERLVGPGDLLRVFKERKLHSHKGDYGRVLVIGGSILYSGAPALAGLSALRTGADLAVIVSPKEVSAVVKSFSPNLIVEPLQSKEFIGENDVSLILELASNADAIIAGPGISNRDSVLRALIKILEGISELNKPVVIDADGLKAISLELGLIKKLECVLTPHEGEYRVITGEKPPGQQKLKERMEHVKCWAEKLNTTILLKGYRDIISDGKEVKVNATGNPGMTVGGTGDVLSGIIGCLLSWKNDCFTSACVGAFLSGCAGDLALKKKGYSLLATDVVEEIPAALKNHLFGG